MTDCCVTISVPDFNSEATKALTTETPVGRQIIDTTPAGPGIDLYPLQYSSSYSPRFLWSTHSSHPTVDTYILTASLLL
jgi:hypothetical protein